jgi:hypothetical protein
MKSPQRIFGKVALIVGASMLGSALILAALGFIFNDNASFVLLLLASIFGLHGAVCLIIGVCFRYYFKSLAVKFMRLKREGLCYDAEILQIIRTNTYQIGRSVSAYAECSYTNLDYKTCLVKSKLFLLEYNYGDKDNFSAKVYVSRKDPRDYFVDIQVNAQASGQFNYDYR